MTSPAKYDPPTCGICRYRGQLGMCVAPLPYWALNSMWRLTAARVVSAKNKAARKCRMFKRVLPHVQKKIEERARS